MKKVWVKQAQMKWTLLHVLKESIIDALINVKSIKYEILCLYINENGTCQKETLITYDNEQQYHT